MLLLYSRARIVSSAFLILSGFAEFKKLKNWEFRHRATLDEFQGVLLKFYRRAIGWPAGGCVNFAGR